jgi:hypothetical protein
MQPMGRREAVATIQIGFHVAADLSQLEINNHRIV